MEINLPYKVKMSVNEMYFQRRRGKFLKKEALNLRALIMEDVKRFIENEDTGEVENLKDKILTVGIIFTEDWNYKNGEIKREDLDNRLKFILDSIFIALDFDDKYIFELYARKNQSENANYTTIIINEAKEWDEQP